ncbi:unnamed protein product [Phytophthora lilii]|uniref:Unnamed protein product n=1 Tax=Phytophthora lilii TaxID=2077276 RepID=A0A9W6WYD5_9STRA|nr:unnamed protein product [Phytophthora lilii]
MMAKKEDQQKLLPQKWIKKLKQKKIPSLAKLPDSFVNNLLANEKLRTKTFKDWAKADDYIDESYLKKSLDMNKESSVKLADEFVKFVE